MPLATPPRIELAKFQTYQSEIMAVRKTVFIDELGINPDLEWDNRDEQALYAIAVSGNEVIGIGRLQADGQLGRIAILPDWRRKGIGTRIVQRLIKAAIQSDQDCIYLSAQIDALNFYTKLGFIKTGAPFVAAGIDHQGMRLLLPAKAATL